MLLFCKFILTFKLTATSSPSLTSGDTYDGPVSGVACLSAKGKMYVCVPSTSVTHIPEVYLRARMQAKLISTHAHNRLIWHLCAAKLPGHCWHAPVRADHWAQERAFQMQMTKRVTKARRSRAPEVLLPIGRQHFFPLSPTVRLISAKKKKKNSFLCFHLFLFLVKDAANLLVQKRA